MTPASFRRLAAPLAGLAIVAIVAACSGAEQYASGGAPTGATAAPPAAGVCPTAQPEPLPAGETRTVTITTDQGDMALKIEADLSPIAAGNFVALAELRVLRRCRLPPTGPRVRHPGR